MKSTHVTLEPILKRNSLAPRKYFLFSKTVTFTKILPKMSEMDNGFANNEEVTKVISRNYGSLLSDFFLKTLF